MNDRDLIWEAYLEILNEGNGGTRIKGIEEFSESEKREVLSKLSDIERGQLGNASGGKSSKMYMSSDDWVRIRDYHLNMAIKRNKETTEDMCAYTPGETLKLLQSSKVQEWFNRMRTFRIPENKKSVVFVPCAASKRWGKTTKSQQYKCIHSARSARNVSDEYFVTISEPLGVVPELHWDDFPMYDNPGLFKRGPHELTKEAWKVKMGYDDGRLYPFDDGAKRQCINILGGIIREFCEFNKRLNPNLRFIGAVGGNTLSTHTEMLNVAGILDKDNMHLSKPEAKGGRYPYDAGVKHWEDILRKANS
jgi:hypothetical protein